MPIWGNFKIAIFSSIYNTFSHFCVVFSDHVLQARGRGQDMPSGGSAARSDGSPQPPSSHTAETAEVTARHQLRECQTFLKCISKFLQ